MLGCKVVFFRIKQSSCALEMLGLTVYSSHKCADKGTTNFY